MPKILIFITLLCSVFHCGCKKEEAQANSLQMTSLSLSNLSDQNRCKELIDYLTLLATHDGNPHILINDTYIYLPPVGTGPMEDKDGNKFWRSYNEVSGDELLIENSSEAEVFEKLDAWIKKHRPAGVSLDLGDDAKFQTALNIIEILSDSDVYYSISSDQENHSKIVIQKLNQINSKHSH
jgi:hypothetical protein